MKKIVLFVCCTVAIQLVFAAKVDTVTIYSKSMHKNVRCVVITPEVYQKDKAKNFPVVYLLHGYSGNYSNWITRIPEIKKWADEFELMLVCPDGAYGSWYIDSPIDSNMRYETNVAVEIPNYIDTHYRTIKNRKGRAIAGLSMGGHGALFIGLRHADFFSACGSMSGALDISAIRKNYEMAKLIGDTGNVELYRRYSVLYQVDKYPKDSIAIIVDCGVNDFLIDMSRVVHQKMLGLKIPHTYIERPGGHSWDYWREAVKYQLLFFRERLGGS